MICVYALTGRQSAPPRGRGLAREPLRVLTAGAVSAIVGTLPRAPSASRDQLTRYDAVIRGLAERLPAVLPARVGTCFPDPEELRMVLQSRQLTFRRALAHVRGRAQMTVRVIGVPGPPRASSPAHAGTRPTGTEYLRGRAAAEREISGFDPVRDAVRRWVRDERVEKQKNIASVYHLVPRRAAPSYRRALERAAAAAGLQVVVSGPWPPYAFAEL